MIWLILFAFLIREFEVADKENVFKSRVYEPLE